MISHSFWFLRIPLWRLCILSESSLMFPCCSLVAPPRSVVRWEGRGRKWWRCWWRASSSMWWALLSFSSSGIILLDGVIATPVRTLCCRSHSQQVIAWLHALTSSCLPYSIVESSIFKSYRCSQEEFYSFRTLCKKKEFQVNERQSSTEKMGWSWCGHTKQGYYTRSHHER
jgi:hypothetical protein